MPWADPPTPRHARGSRTSLDGDDLFQDLDNLDGAITLEDLNAPRRASRSNATADDFVASSDASRTIQAAAAAVGFDSAPGTPRSISAYVTEYKRLVNKERCAVAIQVSLA